MKKNLTRRDFLGKGLMSSIILSGCAPYISNAKLLGSNGIVVDSEEFAKFYGVTLYGSTVQLSSDGILSNFSNYSYAILPYNAGGLMSEPWEISTRISSNNTNGGIFNLIGHTNGFSPFYAVNRQIRFYLNNVGWPITEGAPLTPNSDGWFYIKLTFDGTKYFYSNFYNGIWNKRFELISSNFCHNQNVTSIIGNNRGYSDPYGGMVDLNYSWFRYGQDLIWEGVKGASKNKIT